MLVPIEDDQREAKLLRRRTRTNGTKETGWEYIAGMMEEQRGSSRAVNVSRLLKRNQIANRFMVGALIGAAAYVIGTQARRVYEEHQSKKEMRNANQQNANRIVHN